jgi:hypothetical protein
MKPFALALPAALLAACAATIPVPEYKVGYQPDLADKPAATLRLSSLHRSPAWAGALSGNCVPFTAKDFSAATQGIGVLNAKQPAEQKIPAGAPFTIAFFTTSTTVSGQTATDANCAVGIRFTPDAGADYEAEFSGDSENCRMELGKLGAKSIPGTGEARTTPVPGATEIKSCE